MVVAEGGKGKGGRRMLMNGEIKILQGDSRTHLTTFFAPLLHLGKKWALVVAQIPCWETISLFFFNKKKSRWHAACLANKSCFRATSEAAAPFPSASKSFSLLACLLACLHAVRICNGRKINAYYSRRRREKEIGISLPGSCRLQFWIFLSCCHSRKYSRTRLSGWEQADFPTSCQSKITERFL